MTSWSPYRIFSLGDSALTLDFGNVIDENINRQVMALFSHFQNNPLPGMIEAVPAYSSLTIYYDMLQLRKTISADKTVYDWLAEQLRQKLEGPIAKTNTSSRLITIPVCYEKEFGWDIEEVAALKNISIDELIQIHTSNTYRVFMLGFLPGFAYMGEVNNRIEFPRKKQPRQKVEAGSVGIAGKQTGIYPLAAPGGWQIIGRTPITIFNAEQETPVLFQTGDSVKFYAISKRDFYEIQNSPSPFMESGLEGEV